MHTLISASIRNQLRLAEPVNQARAQEIEALEMLNAINAAQ